MTVKLKSGTTYHTAKYTIEGELHIDIMYLTDTSFSNIQTKNFTHCQKKSGRGEGRGGGGGMKSFA